MTMLHISPEDGRRDREFRHCAVWDVDRHREREKQRGGHFLLKQVSSAAFPLKFFNILPPVFDWQVALPSSENAVANRTAVYFYFGKAEAPPWGDTSAYRGRFHFNSRYTQKYKCRYTLGFELEVCIWSRTLSLEMELMMHTWVSIIKLALEFLNI